MLRRNKVIACLMTGIMGLSLSIPMTNAYAFTNEDYKTACRYAVDFYDANKCGKEVTKDNVFDWRGACHLNDGKKLGIDLTGGYHDAGDHVKFGLPQAYSASVMGWALYEFKGGFQKSGNYQKQLEELKYFTDYLLKCHYAKDKFVYQVGNGQKDHDQFWGAPEDQTDDLGERQGNQSYLVADSSHPASDVLGETAAALAIMYLNYKDIDSAYADKCLQNAKELYDMGKRNQGKNALHEFYSSSNYEDDMAWGAEWLYDATKDSSYLSDAREFVVKDTGSLDTDWTMCWDNMKVPAVLKLYELTKEQKYKDSVNHNIKSWQDRPTVAGGLKAVNPWGSTRYAVAASMIALIYNKYNPSQALVDLASSQIDFVLGKNTGFSYVVGFGDRWPQHVHHRAADGYNKMVDKNYKSLPNKHVLTGALVGGPDTSGNFIDELDRYEYTEVALDYNAGLVGALAGYVDYIFKGNPVTLGDVNGDGKVNVYDYSLLRKYINTGGDKSNYKIHKENADLNSDGKINFIDLAKLKLLF